jgi:hypothetical protein
MQPRTEKTAIRVTGINRQGVDPERPLARPWGLEKTGLFRFPLNAAHDGLDHDLASARQGLSNCHLAVDCAKVARLATLKNKR